MSTEVLRLSEYHTSEAVELSPAQRDWLREPDLHLDIAPTRGIEGHYDVTPSSWIGALEGPGLSILIRPKLPIERVLFMMSYALDPASWRDLQFGFSESESLVEAIAPGFVYQIRKAFARGLLQGYRSQEDSLLLVRGRIRFEDQLRLRPGRLLPIEVRYDDFTEDIEENRLIKAALHTLRQIRLRSRPARESLRAFDATLSNVSLMEYGRAVSGPVFTRLNEHYRSAVELARLILRTASFELGPGGVTTSAFLVDMNQVFEDFVYVALSERLGLSSQTFRQGALFWFDTRAAIAVRPDLSWWSRSKCVFVGDLKYKKIQTGIPNADLYQAFAYATAAELDESLLVYAEGEDREREHTVVNAGKRLSIATLRLTGSPAEILVEIDELAERVRAMADRSRVSARSPFLAGI
jgi:5-methylcytosine-specific restriction enzyme subunit McrC